MPAATFGWSGVDLFFVLSGYLITKQLLSGMGIGEFYLRRALRILPLYWLVLVLYFTVPAFPEQSGIAPFWKFLFFVQNIGLVAETQGAFSHAWSLCIEEHFYLFLGPLLSLGYKRNDDRWLLSVLGLAMVAEALLRSAIWSPEMATHRSQYLTWIYYPTPSHLDGLIVGAALAALARKGALAKVSVRSALIGGMVVLALGAFLTHDRESLAASVFGFTVVSIGYGLLVVAALGQERPRRGPIAASLAWLAYPAYLIHKPILKAAATLTTSADVNVALAVTLVFLGAAVMHLLIERPILRLRERLVRRYDGLREPR